MAISLASLKMVRADKPPRILIYGPPGIGKTTLASEFPNAAFIQVEDGTPGDTEILSFGKLDTYADVRDALGAIYTGDHDIKTLVVDSVTELERLIFAETCLRGDDKGNVKANIEDFGYGKGYVYAQRVWAEFIDGLNALRNDLGITVILIAHSTVERFDDPETVSYDRYEIDLHGKSVGAIEREMDCIFLLKRPVAVKKEDVGFNKERARGEDGGAVLIHTTGKPAYVAKNRYSMPQTIRYERGKGYAALAQYFPAQAEVAAPKKDAA